MSRIVATLLLALVLPSLVLAAMAALGATPGGWEALIAFSLGVVAATVHWRRSSSPSVP